MTDKKIKTCPFCGVEMRNVIAQGGIIEWAEHPSNDCFLTEFELSECPLEKWNMRPVVASVFEDTDVI